MRVSYFQELMLNCHCRNSNSPAKSNDVELEGGFGSLVIEHLNMTSNKRLCVQEVSFNMARLRDDEKLKTFVFKKTLAYELELFAKTKHVSEASLVRRYVEEGMRRDKGQTTLDE